MARTRTVKPEHWTSERRARVSRDARYVYFGIESQSDDYGVVRGTPALLKSLVLPYDQGVTLEAFNGWLKELEGIRLLIPFASNTETYYWLPEFLDDQRIDHPSKARNPNPPDTLVNRYRKAREGIVKCPSKTETGDRTERETSDSQPGDSREPAGDDPPGDDKPKTKAKKKKTGDEPNLRTVTDFWKQVHRDNFEGKEYDFGKVDGILLAGLTGKYGVEVVQDAIRVFFAMNDEWLVEHGGHTVGMFKKRFNQILQRSAGGHGKSNSDGAGGTTLTPLGGVSPRGNKWEGTGRR